MHTMMRTSMATVCSLLVLLAHCPAQAKKPGAAGGMKCDPTLGVWIKNGVATTNRCQVDGGKVRKVAPCNATDMFHQDMSRFPRTCIAHPTQKGGRCWWTYVPDSVAMKARQGEKVPLVVEMHGSGGCAGYYTNNGLGIDLAEKEGFIVVWPQGGFYGEGVHRKGGVWGAGGSDIEAIKAISHKANICDPPAPGDVDFVAQVLAHSLKSAAHKDMIDPERVYFTGFSDGCFMSNRFALERSGLVAAVACQGAGLMHSWGVTPAEMGPVKASFNVRPTPVYLTLGEHDPYLGSARRALEVWKYMNGCSSPTTETTDATTLPGHDLLRKVGSGCAAATPPIEVQLVERAKEKHVPNYDMNAEIWAFMKKYRRPGLLAKLPDPIPAELPSAIRKRELPAPSALEKSSSSGIGAGGAVGIAAACAVAIMVAVVVAVLMRRLRRERQTPGALGEGLSAAMTKSAVVPSVTSS